jgi:dTDP-4-amino-4,6-dideoxygalactose transaminase
LDSSLSNPATQFLRDLTGRKHTVLAGRASAAIWAALRSRGIKGQWVLMPANMCYIVAWAVIQSGNLPYLVDIDPLTGNISPETLDRVQIESPAALIVCHMYGLGAPIAVLSEWANRRGILVIEDATLALGATVDDRPAGSWGDMSLFSFGEGKIVDVGTGGAFLCDDSELARQVQVELDGLPPWGKHLEQLRDQWTELYWLLHQYEQANPRLTTVYPMLFSIFGDITRYQLAASRWDPLVKSLSSLEPNLDHRLGMASLYDEYFRVMQVRTLLRPKGHVIWRYPLLVSSEDRDSLLQVLWENGILASRWYPSLSSMLLALSPSIGRQTTPGADRLGAEVINLPVDHTVDEEMIKRTAEVVQVYFHEKRKRTKRTLPI